MAFLVEMHFFEDTPGLKPSCHIGMAANLFQIMYHQFLCLMHATWFKYGALSIGVLWLLVMLTVGQGFCSWVCFFGGIDDTVSQCLKRPLIKVPSTKKVREFQLAVFVFFLLISFLSVEPIFCTWLCPFKVTNEIINPHSSTFLLQTIIFIAIGVFFLILLPLVTKKRFFCSAICPFGALPPLLDRGVPYKISIDQEKCLFCKKCLNVCPSFAIEEKGDKLMINRYCTLCYRCQGACPNNAIQTTLFHKRPSGIFRFISVIVGGVVSLLYVPSAVFHILQSIWRVFL